MSTTYAALIHEADQRLTKAKLTRSIARAEADAAAEAAKASQIGPFDRERLAERQQETQARVIIADVEATTAGRKLAELLWEEAVDLWVDRSSSDDVVIDERLLALAPRVNGEVDWYWVGAAHLSRSGRAVPRSWRSPISGEPVHATANLNESRPTSA